MRIQHNIAALNSHRQLGGNNSAVGKNLEKLSSGFRINRAGDDAAGLAISEKMRAQIKGLETASKNANDGISLIQTAEGALTEVHSMLNRMVELATQSANGTYGETERKKLENEVQNLKSEIDRISESTNFNGINLLDGSIGEKTGGEMIQSPTAKELVNPIGTGDLATAAGATAATNHAGSFTVAAGDDAKFDVFEIKYKNEEGIEKTLRLKEKAKDGLAETDTMGEKLAGEINGTLTNFDVLDDATGSLKELKQLFNVATAGSDASIKFTAKIETSKAEVMGMKQASNASESGAIGELDGKAKSYELKLPLDTNFEVFELKYNDGTTDIVLQLEEKTESTLGPTEMAGKIAALFNSADSSKDTNFALTTGTEKGMIAAFAAKFNISAEDGKLVISKKSSDPLDTANITSLTTASAVALADATAALVTATAVTPTTVESTKDLTVLSKAQAKGISIDLTNAEDTDTLTIAGKKYEIDKKGDGVTEGNLAIEGATAKEQAENLIKLLKKEGIESHIDLNDISQSKVRITSLDKLEVAQKGITFESKSKGFGVDQTVATKNTSTITFGVGDNAAAPDNAHKLTFNYINENGEHKTVKLDYDSTNVAGTNADAIKAAILKDSELKQLFDVDVAAGAMTITAKTEGTKGAKVLGIETSDATVGVIGTALKTTVEGKDAGKKITFTKDMKVGDSITVNGKTYEFAESASAKVAEGSKAIVFGAGKEEAMGNLINALKKEGIEVDYTEDTANFTVYNGTELEVADENKGGGLVLQVGDTNQDFQKVTVKVESMSAQSLGLDKVSVADQKKSGEATDVIKAAIEKISTARGELGSLQNRLDHTINNLGVTTENMTAAESRIRDVDMAKEMMDFTKNNILTQAAQAMLAQANQLPQGVLQLLQ